MSTPTAKPKTTTAPTPAPAVPPTAPATPAAVPSFSDDAEYRRVVANSDRIKLEVARLEREVDDAQALAEAGQKKGMSRAEKILAGASPDEIGPTTAVELETRHATLFRQLTATRRASELAATEIRHAERDARGRVMTAWQPAYRALVAATLKAMLAFARVAAEHEEVQEELARLGQRGYGGPDSPLPLLSLGDPADPTSRICGIAREAIDAGFVAESDPMLAGVAIPPAVKLPEQPAPKPKKVESRSLRRLLREDYGVDIG